MPKKLKQRKFNYIFSDNTEEENFRIKKEFTEAIRDFFFKKMKGHFILELLVLIAVISLVFTIYYLLNIFLWKN